MVYHEKEAPPNGHRKLRADDRGKTLSHSLQSTRGALRRAADNPGTRGSARGVPERRSAHAEAPRGQGLPGPEGGEDHAPAPGDLPQGEEIGRASCRERVGVTVVAAAQKK